MKSAREQRPENDRAAALERYRAVRATTERLCAPLCTEDYVVQSMADTSPTRWHLAHTTWFFETFVLARAEVNHRPTHPTYSYLFNSYYEAVGERHARPQRGLLSRPTVTQVYAYRAEVDRRIAAQLERGAPLGDDIAAVLELGLHHEQQHQELILTDIKHAFAQNPLRPVYHDAPRSNERAHTGGWHPVRGGVREIGHAGSGFAFDNEAPRHEVIVEAFTLATRPVTCGEFRDFIDDGGYTRPELWLSDGWDAVRRNAWFGPLYWEQGGGEWKLFTLSGMSALGAEEPVCHVSYYEADAFARWAGARLPTEAEWEIVATDEPVTGNLLDAGALHPAPARGRARGSGPMQLFGDVWEWTSSAYAPYPRFRPFRGALGEYNGKFMSGQLVLRGGSCATPQSHVRPTYRNFFRPEDRWQFSGIRLAKDA